MPIQAPFEYPVDIAWGHCDPAGIIYYPNYFRWFDATFHAFLRSRDLDQRILKDKFGTFGTGLIDAGATFRAPVTYGDRMIISLTLKEWREKTLRVGYLGTCEGRPIVEGHELRGMFMTDAETGKLYAAPIAPLRALLQSD
jgi:4-hydroxybenzoyl-CoA thioesterase